MPPPDPPSVSAPTPNAPAAWLSRAMAAHQRGQVDEARATYKALLAIEPDHADGLHLLGILEGQFGSGEAAVALIARAIALNPAEAMFHNNLGNVQLQRGQLAEAEACYDQALALDPARHDAMNNRAILLGRRGNLQAAEAAFLQVLQAAPGFTDARENLAILYLRQGRLGDALTQCAQGMVIAPRAPGLRDMLARGYALAGMKDQARAVYTQWLLDDPDDPAPRHYLAGLDGHNVPERASDAYVARTFDSFAGSFDHTLAQLDYGAPALVGQALQARLPHPAPGWRVLDAGCGTGLCGEHLAPVASRVVGVDLSRRMLEKAATRGHYQELHQEELVTFLKARCAAFDLIVAADTMCYFGTLGDFAAAARQALAGAGWLMFTVESHADEAGEPDYRLHPHGRYSHRRCYVTDTLAHAGFADVQTQAVVLRYEMKAPVEGWLVCARA